MTLLDSKIKLAVFVIALLFVHSTECISAQEKTPRFKNYPAAKIYKGKNAPLKLNRSEKELHAEELNEIVRNEKADFAGHYIVASLSCGMWCNDSTVIDAETGRLCSWDGILSVCLPDFDKDFNCNENFSNIEYRLDSKLIVFFGFTFRNRNDDKGARGFHYYKFENGKFIHLKSVLVKEQREPLQISLDEKTNNNQKTQK